jgi:hypothetical protein
LVEALLACYEIKEKGTRNSVLMQMIGDLAHKFGREAAERIVEEHYRRNQGNVRSSLEEHRREFATAWDGMRKKLVDSLSPEEQQAFNALSSEHQREGFLIVRAFAGTATHNGEKDFAIARASLADRLSITPPGATDVIQKLCESNVIAQTQPSVRHKKAARFCWLLPSHEQFPARVRACSEPPAGAIKEPPIATNNGEHENPNILRERM